MTHSSTLLLDTEIMNQSVSIDGIEVTGIDTHAHIFRTDLPMIEERRYAPDYNALASDFLLKLDAHGISHGILVQPSFLGTDNSFMLDALQKYPKRLRGIAVVDNSISETELDELNELGVVGARLNLIQRPLEDYASTEWQAFFGKLARRNWLVEIQKEIDGLGDILPPILASGVSVIVDHFGRPTEGIDSTNAKHQAFLSLLKDAPIWTKISAIYRTHSNLEQAKVMLDQLRIAYGQSDRFLWGSDWPNTQFEQQTQYEDQFSIMQSLFADPAERQKVLIDNPMTCFQLQSAQTKIK